MMDDKKPFWSLRVLSFLEEAGEPYDDDCLAEALGATRRQTINAVCNHLADQGKLVRQQALCPRCGRIKLHNFLPKWVDELPSLPRAPQVRSGRPRRPSPRWVQERKAELHELEFIYQCSLNELEVRAARYGINTPLVMSNEIDFQKKRLAEIRQELKELEFRMERRAEVPVKKRASAARIVAPPPPPPRTINRFPDVSLWDKVTLNQRCTLRIAVTQRPVRKGLEEHLMIFEVSPGAERTTIDVLVTAEEFEIIGDDCRPLIVPVDGDSEPTLFQMVPRSTGEKKVKVEFFQGSRYVGGVTATTVVVLPTEATDARQVGTQGIIGIEREAAPPDLTMLITESKPVGDQMTYKFKLHSPANGLFYYTVGGDLSFSGSPSKWMEGLYNELGTLGRDASPEDIVETLSTIGSNLYEKLFPRELKEIWKQRIRGKVRSIMIISDEPWIPWEIIKPSYESETGDIVEDDFLCGSYLLTRWIAGSPPPSLIEISRGALIAPVMSKLPNVQREIKFLMASLGNVEEIEPRLAVVRELLRTGGFHLIHFACHGSFDPEEHEQSIVYLQGDDRLKSRDITGEKRNFGKDRPFVFINACQTARADFSLVGIGSWANTFVNVKSSGFLGTSWEVSDELACLFSESFYSALLEGKAIGEAVREARLEIRHAPDPTWLAYTLYADPLAKVIFA